MSKMNKVVITEFGDESKLAIVEDDLPDPAAGEVQLSVEYSIVSGSDVNMRRGAYPFQKEAPLTPGDQPQGTFDYGLVLRSFHQRRTGKDEEEAWQKRIKSRCQQTQSCHPQ